MTIDQAIHTVDSLKPNTIERARKIDWLDRLDRRIYRDVMLTHESRGDVPETFDGYDQATSPDTELLALPPHDEMYRFYLEMQIDLTNREYESYNTNASLFDAAWGKFAREWHREHRSLTDTDHHHFGDRPPRERPEPLRE